MFKVLQFIELIPRRLFEAFIAVYLAFAVIIRTFVRRAQISGVKPVRDSADPEFDVICFSHVPWTHIWQRNHHTMGRLSRHRKVLYVQTTSIAYVHWFAHLWPGSLREHQIWYPGIELVYPLLLPGQSKLPFVGWLNRWILSTDIKWYEHRMGMKNTVLWFYYPAVVNVLGAFNPAAVIYDIQDEYTAFNWSPGDISQRERDLLAQADVIFGGTYALYEQKKIGFRGASYFYPCGVEFGHFFRAAPIGDLHALLDSDRITDEEKTILRQVLEDAKQEPPGTISHDVYLLQDAKADAATPSRNVASEAYIGHDITTRLKEPACMRHVGRPRLIYVGLVDKRIDADLICHLAQARPEWEIVMIGPVDSKLFSQKTVESAASNVHFFGPHHYSHLPSFLANCDVYLMPWKVNNLTKHINPTKTLEYMAAGRPVVSIALPDLERMFSDSVALARTYDEFVDRCTDAMEGRLAGNVVRGLARAQSFSWEKVVAEMEEHVREAIVARDGSRRV